MKRFIYILAAFALMGAVSCQPDEEVAVHASFTTDKESYDVGDPVVLTNTSTAENALIAICKWELGKGVVSYETTPENISYDQAGEYVIKLTVTSDRGAKKSSFEKTIRVVDNNIRPVADFTWSPEKVVAGEPVQFTDRSTDEDGEVVAWEWKFGTTTSDKQNPEFTFAAQGATEVSLTVTDNKKGRNTKTVTIDVGRGAISLDLLWSYPYDDTKDAYVFGTSPAVSPDGEYVYVTSTGYSLVCFTKAGERLWAFDIGKDGASAENNSGSIKVQSPTPSVDEDGTVYALAGFNEPNKDAGGSAFYAVSGGAGGGSQVWHVNTGVNTSFRFLSPAVTEKYLFIVARNVPPGETAVVSVGTFQAGIASNVIPESAVMELSVRAMKPEIRDLLIKRIHELADFTAKSYGASSVVEVYDSYPVLTNSPEETDFARALALEVFGREGVLESVSPMNASEDFAFMLRERPGSYFLLGNGEKGEKGGCMVHNPGYDFNDDIITIGATLFARLVEKHCR